MKSLFSIWSLLTMLFFTNGSYPQNFWEQAGNIGSAVNRLTISSEGSIFAGTESSGVFRSTDFGDSWFSVNNGLPLYWITDILSTGTSVFVAMADSGLYKSEDYGNTWIRITGIGDEHIIALDDRSITELYASSYSAVHRSTDSGETWVLYNNGIDGIRSVLAYSSSIVIAGGTSGSGIGGIYRSSDFGESWANVALSGQSVHTLVETPSGAIFSGSSVGAHISTDQGITWISRGLTEAGDVSSLAANTLDYIFAGKPGGAPSNYNGVFLSTDLGLNWVQIVDGLTNRDVRDLFIEPDGFAFVATAEGVFRSTQSTTSIANEGNIHLYGFLLSQNYPNPFNPLTILKFTIPQQANVVLKVFDILGNEIGILVNEEKPAGTYEITWYAENLLSGVYFYRIQAGSFVETKKMVLLR